MRAVRPVEIRAAGAHEVVFTNHVRGKYGVLLGVARIVALHAVEPEAMEVQYHALLLAARESHEADFLMEMREARDAARLVDERERLLGGDAKVQPEGDGGGVEIVIPQRLRAVVHVERH